MVALQKREWSGYLFRDESAPAGCIDAHEGRYRSADKHDPLDYARRTVIKAQAELGSSSRSEERGEPGGKDESREQGA